MAEILYNVDYLKRNKSDISANNPTAVGNIKKCLTCDTKRILKIQLIIILEQGTIIEQGTHVQLLTKSGLYADLRQRQHTKNNQNSKTLGTNNLVFDTRVIRNYKS